MGVRVVLEELGQPYELIATEIGVGLPRSSELLSLNPNGWVPVLTWENSAMYECGAIVTFLCDRHSYAGLAPAREDDLRGKFLQWLFFFSSSLQNAYQMTYYSDRFCQKVEHEDSVKQRSISRLRELWRIVDTAIGDQCWLLGKRFSAADIYLFMLTTWLREERHHPAIREFPNVSRIASKVMKRKSVQAIYAPSTS
jgi:glutathione S-transferase